MKISRIAPILTAVFLLSPTLLAKTKLAGKTAPKELTREEIIERAIDIIFALENSATVSEKDKALTDNFNGVLEQIEQLETDSAKARDVLAEMREMRNNLQAAGTKEEKDALEACNTAISSLESYLAAASKAITESWNAIEDSAKEIDKVFSKYTKKILDEISGLSSALKSDHSALSEKYKSALAAVREVEQAQKNIEQSVKIQGILTSSYDAIDGIIQADEGGTSTTNTQIPHPSTTSMGYPVTEETYNDSPTSTPPYLKSFISDERAKRPAQVRIQNIESDAEDDIGAAITLGETAYDTFAHHSHNGIGGLLTAADFS